MEHAFQVRSIFWLANISVFRVLDEAWLVRDRPTHCRVVKKCTCAHMWMRLRFNKPGGAQPPRAPKPVQSMISVHGQALSTREAGTYGTRQQSLKRVRFRLAVPTKLVPELQQSGRHLCNLPEPVCVKSRSIVQVFISLNYERSIHYEIWGFLY